MRDASPEETARSKLLPETQTDFANLTIPSDAHKTPQTTASPKQYKLREHAERTDPELVKPKAPRKLSHESKQTHIVRKLRRARGLWTMQTLTKQELRKTVADAAQLAVEAALASVGHTVQHALVTGTNPDHRALHDCSRSLVRNHSQFHVPRQHTLTRPRAPHKLSL